MSLSSDEKQSILATAQTSLKIKVQHFQSLLTNFNNKIEQLRKLAPELMNEDRNKVDPGTEESRILFAKADIRETQTKILTDLIDSPYFTKCEVEFDNEPGIRQTFYFSKHSWTTEEIYSWVAAVSTIRFEAPGEFKFEKPDGTFRSGKLLSKENYIITGSEIAYLTYESEEELKQLIYQKHLSERKQFALPEIVAELEKAQDQIIRSNPAGGLLVTGSAGSGKTTLALHRIAYLVYSPELKNFFSPERIIVFVADHNAINYFNKLLPDLGIDKVKITTFSDWGIDIVNNYYHSRFKPLHLENALDQIESEGGLTVDARLIYDEFRKAKVAAIDIIDKEGLTVENLFATYLELVNDRFADEFRAFLDFQRDLRFLDETDITILLSPFDRPTKSFLHVVVDEVQNWLPMQLDLVQRIIEFQYKSISYIGDIKQKTKAFSIENWEQLQSGYPIDSTINLSKVYRNTKQVLSWLAARGYEVNPDTSTKNGPEVTEQAFATQVEQHTAIDQLISRLKDTNKQVGILAKYRDSLRAITSELSDNIHLMTIEAAQGLEFDTVIVIDAQDLHVGEEFYRDNVGYTSAAEYSAVDKQLLYVAATRAENELMVFHVN
jgi:DNA helicase IV